MKEHGSLEGCAAGRRVTNEELLELDCDILVLAAREDQVTAENALRLRTRMIVEGANGPTSFEADEMLAEARNPVLPDILTNAGGVTVSYFEWVQDLGRLFWTRDEIRAKLSEKLSDAFDRVWDLSEDRGVTLRQARPRRRYPRGLRRARREGDLSRWAPSSARRWCRNPGQLPGGRVARRRRASSCSARRYARST